MLALGPEWLTIILFGSLVLLLAAGLPLVFAIGGVATFFIIILWGPHALPVLANRTYMAMDMFLLVAVPMFIFMGAMLQRCGIAEDMYELMYHWMGGLRGGLLPVPCSSAPCLRRWWASAVQPPHQWG